MPVDGISKDKVTLNTVFKEQAVELKRVVKREFDIQISVEKLAMDDEYRETVLIELESLGNYKVSEQVTLLRSTPVYTESFITQYHQADKPKKSKKFLWLLLLLIPVICFFLIQNNYIQVNLTSPHSETPNQVIEIADSPQPLTSDVEASNNLETITNSNVVSLPSEDAEQLMRLHGSNTVGEHLAPALLEGYLTSIGITKMEWIQGDSGVERELQYIENNKVYAIELHAHGSSTAFKDLLSGSADLGMSSRQIKDSEVDKLKVQYGNLGLAGNEFIIGLDGLATIINPENSLTQLTTIQIAKIFSGEITNWKELGGEDLTINLYARDENSGTWDTFKNLVLKANNKTLLASAKRYESSSELSDAVAADKSAIGFIGLPYVNNSKALSIGASEGANPIYPTRFTISTEDYPLARRLYMYAPSASSQIVKDFTHFTASESGQNIVEKVGLISQNIKVEKAYKIANAPKAYNDYTQVANRLSVNFRFKSGSNQLDNKGQKDVLRLVDYMSKNQGRRIVLMGFSDALGDANNNVALSIMRANVLEQKLASYGINVTAVEGFGAQLPIASNKTNEGRSKNRRVEVWIY